MTDSQNIKRLFIAVGIYPNKYFWEDFNLLKEDFSNESIKWVQKEGIHITLHFFGETETEKIPIIKSMMKKAVQNIEPFRIQIGGCGYFEKSKVPSVIFTKIEKHSSLISLHKSLQQLLEENDFPIDNQQFKPHLTLGRTRQIKDYENFKETIDDFKDSFQWQQEVKELILFESSLSQRGAEYRVVEKTTLPLL